MREKIQLKKNYSLLDCENKRDSILEAVRKSKFKNHTEPLTIKEFLSLPAHFLNPIKMYKEYKLYNKSGYY